MYARCPLPPTPHNHKGWRSAPDAILPGHRRAPQWVPARTPTVHWGPVNGEAVGGPQQPPKGEVPHAPELSTVVANPLSIATVSCESGTSAKLVDTSVRLVGVEFGTSAELVGTSVRLVGLRIMNERGARRNECETRCWLTLKRVRNSLLESFRSRRFSLLAGLDAKVTIWIDLSTLNPWLWRANRLNHNGRCSASFAATGECSDESECCT